MHCPGLLEADPKKLLSLNLWARPEIYVTGVMNNKFITFQNAALMRLYGNGL